MPDFLPRRDNDLHPWSTTFANWCNANGVANGITLPQISDLTDLVGSYGAVLAGIDQQLATLNALYEQKRAIRADLEAQIRLLKGLLNPNLTDPERAAAGLTVPKRTLVAARPPETRPLGQVDASKPLAHTLKFTDAATPTRRAKPQGVRHAEIWLKIGDPKPTDNTNMRFVGLATRPTFIQTFQGEDANKTAHYLLRWVNTRNQPGPWSEVHSATIGGV